MEETFDTETTPATKIMGLTVPAISIPSISLGNFDLSKVDLSKIELPKFDLPTFDRGVLEDVAGSVKQAATASVSTVTETASKVRDSAAHTLTLVREAVGV